MTTGRLLVRALGPAAVATLLFGGQASAMQNPPQGAGYSVTTFAVDDISGCGTTNAASRTCYFNADSLTNDQTSVFVGYQNSAAADGSSGSSIVAKYSQSGGTPLAFSPSIPGKTDGLRFDPFTGEVWALNNEDANPMLRILDPATMSIIFTTPLPTNTPFAGGYDDLAFTPEGTFISASNPALTKNGINNHRAVARLDIANGQVVLNPVLPGQVLATDRSTGAQVKVDITDPDSLSVIPGSGTVVLDDQGDSTLLFLDKAGGGAPNVSALFLKPAPTTDCGAPPAPPAVACPPIVDETTWVTRADGRLLLADHHMPGAIYSVRKDGGYVAGTVYTTVSSDNPTLANTLGTLDTTSGAITPAVTGFSGPKGLIFLP